jgi:hypothetical protein
MASSHTIERSGRADWTLMTAIHQALRRDLDELITTTAGPAAAWARWIVFRDQLRCHLAAEHAAMWRPAWAKLTSDPRGQALLEAMDDEQQLIGPLQAVADDAFTMAARPAQVRPLLARLQTKLTSHPAHEETDALPLLGQIICPRPSSARSPGRSAAEPAAGLKNTRSGRQSAARGGCCHPGGQYPPRRDYCLSPAPTAPARPRWMVPRSPPRAGASPPGTLDQTA